MVVGREGCEHQVRIIGSPARIRLWSGDMIKADTQLLYASDWPHFNFDLPSEITDLPFLSEQSKRNILGLNAARIFNLDPTPVKQL